MMLCMNGNKERRGGRGWFVSSIKRGLVVVAKGQHSRKTLSTERSKFTTFIDIKTRRIIVAKLRLVS